MRALSLTALIIASSYYRPVTATYDIPLLLLFINLRNKYRAQNVSDLFFAYLLFQILGDVGV